MSWFELALIFSVTGTTLILSMRAITHETNPFLFMAIVTALASALFFGYCLISNTPYTLPNDALRLAALAGISVAVLDLAFIFMFRKAAPVSVAMPIFRVSGIMIAAMIGYTFFKEQISVLNAVGIVLACIAVYLLNSKPTKVES